MFQVGAVRKKVICGIRNTLPMKAAGRFQKLSMNSKLQQRHFCKTVHIMRLQDIIGRILSGTGRGKCILDRPHLEHEGFICINNAMFGGFWWTAFNVLRLEAACEVEEFFIGMLKWQMTRQKFRKVILYVKACRPRGRREEAVPGGWQRLNLHC